MYSIDFGMGVPLQLDMMIIYKQEYERFIDIKVGLAQFHNDMKEMVGKAINDAAYDKDEKEKLKAHYEKIEDIDYSVLPDRQVVAN
ncbi:hypothetical protein ACFLZM_06970 [Thermodesulfobacteriota bacterium]